MPAISIDLEMKRKTNDKFVAIAEKNKPELIKKKQRPLSIVNIDTDKQGKAVVVEELPIEELSGIHMGKGDHVCLDFGCHLVGYVALKIKSVGSPQDAPAYFKLKFGEVAKEIIEKTENYDGWISRGWIQEEYVHIDVLPAVLKLPRRYAFRYLEIETIDTSLKWQMVIEEVWCTYVSSVDEVLVKPHVIKRGELEALGVDHTITSEFINKLDNASLRTLQNCMQDVFEDGPKRDRRLWLGDLRLQALANYKTFRNYDLVKRCLYLFAGLTRADGRIGACLFTQPLYIVDDTFFFDYSLFFVSVLYDYYQETKDIHTLKELWPSAIRQIIIAKESVNEQNLVEVKDEMSCFIDWKKGLDKHASAQAILIYALKQAKSLADILEKADLADELNKEIAIYKRAAVSTYFDETQGLFVSGDEKQISYASQVWMILAGVVDKNQGAELLTQIVKIDPQMEMVTPYMNHHYVESLIVCGMKKEALEYMKYYWGGMLDMGADTFWEMYNPKNPQESPYGSSIVNSYCHAWSCTPAYLLRKYF